MADEPWIPDLHLPVIAEGRIYLSTAHANLYELDLLTGEQLQQFMLESWQKTTPSNFSLDISLNSAYILT